MKILYICFYWQTSHLAGLSNLSVTEWIVFATLGVWARRLRGPLCSAKQCRAGVCAFGGGEKDHEVGGKPSEPPGEGGLTRTRTEQAGAVEDGVFIRLRGGWGSPTSFTHTPGGAASRGPALCLCWGGAGGTGRVQRGGSGGRGDRKRRVQISRCQG